MRKTETGYRCEACTRELLGHIAPGECSECDHSSERGCRLDLATPCPSTTTPPEPPRGPYSAAEETRGRARAELAAERTGHPCRCGSKNWTWASGDRRKRIGVLLTCHSCGETTQSLLTRESVYALTIEHRLVVVERDTQRALYRLEALEAVAITENVDHDVLTFRAGGETQCWPVDDAEPIERALVEIWGRP
jgi:hypothetical protein